jgi:DNA-binding transcriptional MerR regulator
MSRGDYITLRKALKDYLKEHGVTLSDLLNVMDEDKEGIMEALGRRVYLTREQRKALERSLSSRELNLLLFVIQAFYLLNPSGLYKGLIIEPTKEDVMLGDKATFEGCKMILKALGISTRKIDV